jgi:hypothetical protein
VFPEAREGRCWFRKTANVLAALPKSVHPGAKKALAGIWGAEDKDRPRTAVKAFETAYGARFPKAAAKITDDLDELLAFYDYPAERWVHLRTTNPIDATFATVRHRTKVTKGPGSRAAGLAMAFKLIEAAQTAGVSSTLPAPSLWPGQARSSATASSPGRKSRPHDRLGRGVRPAADKQQPRRPAPGHLGGGFGSHLARRHPRPSAATGLGRPQQDSAAECPGYPRHR